MRKPDIVCLGTGRSGTSFIAKVLAEKLGVCWGRGIDPTPNKYPHMASGKWEDSQMRTHNLNLEQNMITPGQWLGWFGKAHERCDEKYSLHGIKDPRLALINPLAWKHIRPGLIVEGWRTEEQVITSRRKKSTKIYDDLMHQGCQEVVQNLQTYWEWYEEMCRYNLAIIARVCSEEGIPHVVIDMSTRRAEEEVIKEVRGALPV